MRFLLKVLAAPIVAVLAVSVPQGIILLVIGLAVRGGAVLHWDGDGTGRMGGCLCGRVRSAGGIRSPGYHPPGNRVPAQSSGPAYGGNSSAGKSPGAAVPDTRSRLRIGQETVCMTQAVSL